MGKYLITPNKGYASHIILSESAFGALKFALTSGRFNLEELDSGFIVEEITNGKKFKVDYSLNIKEEK